MQQQTQKSSNQSNEKKTNKIGKPKGMNSSKPLEKTNAWSSNQQSTQAIQTLSRLGRFICFQQTGTKKPVQDQNMQIKGKKKQNQQEIPGIFLNNIEIQIAKLIGDYCLVTQNSNKNCIVFFFSSTHPEFQIIDGVPVLINNYEIYGNYPPLQKLAPMLNQKFLNEYHQYLRYQDGLLQVFNLHNFFHENNNKNLKDAETILQSLFTKYLIQFQNDTDLLEKKKFEQKVETYYQEFYNKPSTKLDYETYVNELLACMQIDDEDDCQYKQD
ncbi:unnamed protein product [Paramecium sonneborni]|uniref:Uncharacterized protein n=1 Tax=Paramecium sonneborni TaxID=65129 RepID=A0A8S1MRB8_9CILI|nr:unnamed protein product [Paramecium sonneborni]